MRMFTRLAICWLLTVVSISSFAVSIPYIPQVNNYNVSDYKAGNQNWSVAQDENGIMYFGNNRGLLEFDGVRWKLYPIPNNLSVRSVFVASDRRIYTGSFEEFGYFEPDETNTLQYHSLSHLVNDHTFSNEEIWTINEHEGNIFFQSFDCYFLYNGATVKTFHSDFAPLFFFRLNNNLYAQFIEGDFCRYEDSSFRTLVSRSELGDADVVAVLPYDDALLLVTTMQGLYLYKDGTVHPWENTANEIIKNSVANRATMTRDSTYIIGSIQNGVTAVRKDGRQLWHINYENKLQNNTVLGLQVDMQNNLWVAMDNGISYIETQSPLYFYEPTGISVGMVYDMVIHNNIIYLATNQGVYMIDSDNGTPRLIEGTEGHTWYIDVFDNQIFAGHNTGTLLIRGNRATRIDWIGGGGTVLRKVTIHGKEVLLQASYTLLSVFTKNIRNQWEFSHTVEGFSNPVKTIEVDPEGNIWAGHMYKGAFRLTLDESLRHVNDIVYIEQLDETIEAGTINVMKLRGRIVLTDGSRFYTFEDLSNTILLYDALNEQYPELADTYKIVALNNDRFWFIGSTEYVLLSYEKGEFTASFRVPFSMFKNPIIENKGNIYIDRNGDSYFTLNGGMAHFIPNQLATINRNIPLEISSAQAYNRRDNRQINMPIGKSIEERQQPVALSPDYNQITFELRYPVYSTLPPNIVYKLEGFDTDWQELPQDLHLHFSNLPYGSYNLVAAVKDNQDRDITRLNYAFRIQAPFYRSSPAILIYILLFGGLLYLAIRFFMHKELQRKNKALEKERIKQKKLLEAQEQTIIKLKNEKLENDLNFKSKELATTTLALIAQNDFLSTLKKELQQQQISGKYSRQFFEKVIRMINETITKEDEWAVYQTNFDRIHEQFFVKLKERYPDLTPGDLRMCALLRINMPSKDVARMLNLSVRGVEAARYRLRKKLDLTEGESLVDFMIRFS